MISPSTACFGRQINGLAIVGGAALVLAGFLVLRYARRIERRLEEER